VRDRESIGIRAGDVSTGGGGFRINSRQRTFTDQGKQGAIPALVFSNSSIRGLWGMITGTGTNTVNC
jgi:hypothetical protein